MRLLIALFVFTFFSHLTHLSYILFTKMSETQGDIPKENTFSHKKHNSNKPDLKYFVYFCICVNSK